MEATDPTRPLLPTFKPQPHVVFHGRDGGGGELIYQGSQGKALPPGTDTFREFPEYVDSIPEGVAAARVCDKGPLFVVQR